MCDYQKEFNKKQFHLCEQEVIELISHRNSEQDICDLRHLMHFVAPDLQVPEYLQIKGMYIAQMILRGHMGFDKNMQPGDFDLVVIPYSDLEIHFERTAVIEVKVVRPTVRKPSRNANSLGIKQVEGLIKDGFPFVGLIHVSITEPLPDQLKQPIKLCTLPVGDNSKFEEGKTLKDYLVDIKVDHFSWASTDTQLKRLVATGLPKFVGLHCCGLDKMEDGTYKYSQVSHHLEPLTKGYFNPNRKLETIEKVKVHFDHNRDIYINRRVRNMAKRKGITNTPVIDLLVLKQQLKPGEVYRRVDLAKYTSAVDLHLTRLVKEEVLQKVARDLYYCPKKSVYGVVPPEDKVLLRSFLKTDEFLLMSPNFYNGLRVGTTQLYNLRVVYNHKRHGEIELNSRKYLFRKIRCFPKKATSEFLLVDLVNHLDTLAENRGIILKNALAKAETMDVNKLKLALGRYGNKRTKKLFGSVLEQMEAKEFKG